MTEQEIIARHIQKVLPLLKRQPKCGLQYPYLSVAWGEKAPYDTAVFGWDDYWAALRLAVQGEPEWIRYNTDNFLNIQDLQTGFVPQMIWLSESGMAPGADVYYPLLAQGVLLYTTLTGDETWAESIVERVELYLRYYETELQDTTGLFYWPLCWSGGVDNDAAIAFFPNGSVCPPNVNALMYLEYRSMEKLRAILGKPGQEAAFRDKAIKLRDKINLMLWSEEDYCYAPYHRTDGYVGIRLRDESCNTRGIGLYAFLSFTNLMPLLAGIAPPDRACNTIERYLLSRDHFFSDWGIRSLSRSSEYYNNAVWGNPPRYDYDRLTNSNWQGPVWVIVNYFMLKALVDYGYAAPAREAMANLRKALARDISENGVMHENYDAETGKPLYADHYGSWNMLADLMFEEVEASQL